MKNSIVVIGSTNTDMVIKTTKFPSPGETVIGGDFFLFPGGKGANQAVAGARLGGNVTFITKVGNDSFGDQAIEQFKKEKINTAHVCRDGQTPTGVALITVNAQGENSIVVAPGANGTLTQGDVAPALSFGEVILLQLEIPLDTVSFIVRELNARGKKVIVNPAPAAKLPADIFEGLFCITPNQSEAEALTGIVVNDKESAERAAGKLRSFGVMNVIITMGSEGAFMMNAETSNHIPGIQVNAVDTTAAGDVFCVALAAGIAEEMPMIDSVHFANKAAAASVARMGAQSSAPFKHELESAKR